MIVRLLKQHFGKDSHRIDKDGSPKPWTFQAADLPAAELFVGAVRDKNPSGRR
jgi:hypothetical protein